MPIDPCFPCAKHLSEQHQTRSKRKKRPKIWPASRSAAFTCFQKIALIHFSNIPLFPTYPNLHVSPLSIFIQQTRRNETSDMVLKTNKITSIETHKVMPAIDDLLCGCGVVLNTHDECITVEWIERDLDQEAQGFGQDGTEKLALSDLTCCTAHGGS